MSAVLEMRGIRKAFPGVGSPRDALYLGIRVIHPELNLMSHLSVTQFPYEMGKAAVQMRSRSWPAKRRRQTSW